MTDGLGDAARLENQVAQMAKVLSSSWLGAKWATVLSIGISLTWASQKCPHCAKRKEAPYGAIMHLTGTALPRPVPFQPSPVVDVCLAADPAPPVPYSAVQCSAVQRTIIYRYSHRSFAVARAVHHDLHRKSYLHRRSLGCYTKKSSQSDEDKVTLLPIHLQQHQAGLREDLTGQILGPVKC